MFASDSYKPKLPRLWASKIKNHSSQHKKVYIRNTKITIEEIQKKSKAYDVVFYHLEKNLYILRLGLFFLALCY